MKNFLENLSPPAVLLCACVILLMIPFDDEKRPLSVACAVIAFISAVVLPLLAVPARFLCAVMMLQLAVYIGVRTHNRFRREFTVSSKKSRSLRVRCEARIFYSALCFVAGYVSVVFEDGIPEWLMTVLLAALCILLAYRAVSGRTLFVPVRVRKKLSNVPDEVAFRDISLRQLFDRTVAYLDEKKPYANSSLLQKELARTMGVSAKELSKAISLYSRDTYPVFIRKYRVQYAMNLMSRDPKLKISEVGRMSGFQSESTFLDSFKDITRMTPSEFKRHQSYLQKKNNKN